MFESMMVDAKVAFRTLVKSPGFSVVVVLTLAVGIGANTAIFSVVDAVLLRPLPYPEPDEVVTLVLDRPDGATGALGFSDAGYRHFLDKNRSFEAFGAYFFQSTELPLTGTGEPTQLSVGIVTNGVYAALGVPALRGRLPSGDEDVAGGPLVAVLSHDLWVTRFGADPAAIGSTIELDDRTREVIGIMPPHFAFPDNEIDLWIPLQLGPASENIGLIRYLAVARLRDDATVESATTDVDDLVRRLGEVGYGPEWFERIFAGRAHVQTLKQQIVGDSRRLLLIVLGAVSFVLLIACANVANLFLARAEGRLRQSAVRAALGATRARLIRYLLTESILLALVGGLGGLALAYVGIRWLGALAPPGIPRLHEVEISATVFWYTGGVSVLAGLLFGILPTLRTGPAKLRSALTDGGRGSTAGRDRLHVRGLLVAAEVALALVLLIGSGLMVRTFRQLASVDPGFDPGGVVTFGLTLPTTRYAGTDAEAQFFDRLLERVRARPGVEAAGATTSLPLRGGPGYTVGIEGFPTAPGEFPPVIQHRWVTPGYFEAMRIPVVRGRTVEPEDDRGEPAALFVSTSLEEQYWPSTSAIGNRIGTFGAVGTITGVVGDVRLYGLDAPPDQVIYLPLNWPRTPTWRAMSVAVRTSGDPLDLVPTLRREVAALDPGLPLGNIESMNDVVRASMSRTSFTMFLLLLAAVVAAFLGSVGIYGVLSYLVGQRTPEIGVRAALGADAAAIQSHVLGKGMMPAVIGTAVGLAGAALMSRMLESLLFGITPFDPVTFIAGPIMFLMVAMLGCVVPARRAARIDPASALRND
jgi:putative ABC transport system permease protein